jgi:hypothetical protein
MVDMSANEERQVGHGEWKSTRSFLTRQGRQSWEGLPRFTIGFGLKHVGTDNGDCAQNAAKRKWSAKK